MNVITRSVVINYLLVFTLSLAISVALLLFMGASLDLPKDVGVAEIVLMLPYLLPEAVRNAMQAAALFAACSGLRTAQRGKRNPGPQFVGGLPLENHPAGGGAGGLDEPGLRVAL